MRPDLADILVSVIIPVYNVERYIGRCLQSVCAQTHSNMEILIVDDGSKDSSARIYKGFQKNDARIRVIKQENRGLGLARDAGIDAARGEWLCFVDSDDFVDSRYVEVLLETAISHDCLLAQCRHRKAFDEEEGGIAQPAPGVELFSVQEYWLFTFYHRFESIAWTPFGVWTSLYHASLFRNIRFGNCRFAEDMLFSPKIAYAAGRKSIGLSNQILYHYVQRPDSLLHRRKDLTALDGFLAKQKALAFIEETGDPIVQELFRLDYFEHALDYYFQLSRDLPEEHAAYAHIKQEIERMYEYAISSAHPLLTFPPHIHDLYLHMMEPAKEYVLYGFGNIGMNVIMPWAAYFGWRILEIWDRRANSGGKSIGNIPFCVPHAGLDPSVIVIIAIGDAFISHSVKCSLRELGYSHFIGAYIAESVLRYAKFQKFLPGVCDVQH